MQVQVRPDLLLVHWARSGQPLHARPKITFRFAVTRRVTWWGQVTAVSSALMVKSSRVNPPGTAGRNGIGLMTASCPAGPGRPGLASDP